MYDFHNALKRRLALITEPPSSISIPKARIEQQQAMPSFTDSNSDFDKFKRSIKAQESGGNYAARNPTSGAMGAYQIMPSNLGGTRNGWDFEALGYDVNQQQFLSSPELQEKIATFKLQQYFNKYGPAGAAVAWYAGPGAVAKSSNSTRSQGAYPSIDAYKKSILKRMGTL